VSLEKARVKAGLVAEIGKSMEERVVACKVDVSRREGARAGMIDAGKKMQGYIGAALVSRFEDENLGLGEQKLMMSVARQMFGLIDNLATSQEIEMHKASGALAEAQRTAGTTHKLWKELDGHVAVLEEAEGQEPDPDAKRPTGARPPPSIASRRKAAKEAAEGGSTPTDIDIDAAVEAVNQDTGDTQSSAPEPKPKRKRRSRAKAKPKE
jgi:hypothetical protein